MGAKRILALGSVAALCAGAAAPLFMASAASAAADAVTICANATGTGVIGVNLLPGLNFQPPVVQAQSDGLGASLGLPPGFGAPGGPQAGRCNVFFGDQLLFVTGPKGATGAQGAVGPTGGTGGTGSTGPVGNQGLKGAQGLQGGTGGPGGIGNPGTGGAGGAQGATGITGLGPTGVPGFIGDNGIIGPQGPTGAQGVTGTTGSAIPGTIFPACGPACLGTAANQIFAGPGFLGNTKTWGSGGTVAAGGPSQIVLTCPAGTLVAGGADLLPGDVPPGQGVRGVLESSFPNPTNNAQWIVSAVVTATSSNTTVAPAPAGPNVVVVPYVICR